MALRLSAGCCRRLRPMGRRLMYADEKPLTSRTIRRHRLQSREPPHPVTTFIGFRRRTRRKQFYPDGWKLIGFFPSRFVRRRRRQGAVFRVTSLGKQVYLFLSYLFLSFILVCGCHATPASGAAVAALRSFENFSLDRASAPRFRTQDDGQSASCRSDINSPSAVDVYYESEERARAQKFILSIEKTTIDDDAKKIDEEAETC